MSKVHRLKAVQKIPAAIEEVWPFFSDPRNLLVITPPFLQLKLTNDVFGDAVYAGQVMTYTVKPVMGIPLSWMTEITHVDAPTRFVDEQRKGPYALWHHQHHFKSIEGGVEMTDLVHYRLPFGWIGELAHPVLVKKKLTEIFSYRFGKINETFGAWKGQDLNMQID